MLQCVHLLFKNHIYVIHTYILRSLLFVGDPSRGGFLKWALIKRDHALAESIARTAATTTATSTATSTSTSRSQQSTNPSSSTTALVWREDHCYTSEPIFVSNPAGSSEDDGVVLSEVTGETI